MIKVWFTEAVGGLLHIPEGDQFRVLRSVFALTSPTTQASAGA